jgi:Protein of unknown function (DUF3311)
VTRGWLVALGLLALFLLHNDLWWWRDPTLVWGLPIGLAYHLLFCLATAAFMTLLARRLSPPGRDSSGNR